MQEKVFSSAITRKDIQYILPSSDKKITEGRECDLILIKVQFSDPTLNS